MTTSPSQSPSFPGSTGESRKALDARLRPAGMTRQLEWNFRACQFNNDGFVKSRFYPVFVIPAKAGIQLNQAVLDSRLRGSDGVFDFLRDHQTFLAKFKEPAC
jgi:hypothetical protein